MNPSAETVNTTEEINICDLVTQCVFGMSQSSETTEVESGSTEVEIPIVLTTKNQTEREVRVMGKQAIFLDKKVCLICTHLVGELGKKTKSCTAKKGNTRCPAQFIQISVGVDVDSFVDSAFQAIQNRDTASLIAVLQEAEAAEGASDAIFNELEVRLFEPAEVEVGEDDGEQEPAAAGTGESGPTGAGAPEAGNEEDSEDDGVEDDEDDEDDEDAAAAI